MMGERQGDEGALMLKFSMIFGKMIANRSQCTILSVPRRYSPGYAKRSVVVRASVLELPSSVSKVRHSYPLLSV